MVAKHSKYNAIKTVVDGVMFDSKREAQRYGELKLLEKAGEISRLHLQPVFVLGVTPRDAPGKTILVGKYRADFAYTTKNGDVVVEDVKGVKTAVYCLKKRLVEALYGIMITEIT